MTGRYRGAGSVEKLLKIARAEAEIVRIDLADIDRAKVAAEVAINEVEATVAREESASRDAAAFAAYAEAMRERRFNLRKTLDALEIASETARTKLSSALLEIAKLERLADINERDALTERRRREARLEAENAAPIAAAQSQAASR